MFTVAFRESKKKTELIFQAGVNPFVTRLTVSAGHLNCLHNQPVPSFMKKRHWLMRLTMLVLSPLLIFNWIVNLAVLPITKLEERRKRKKLHLAKQASGVSEP
jgi:hypothetical protein